MLQSKLKCVLETMVAENPHMAGWFADDLGSRSWFPGFDWGSFPDKAGYRAGAIALTQTLPQRGRRARAGLPGQRHLVGQRRRWLPRPSRKPGNALADGGFVEHHDGQIGYFGPYGCSSQWAAQSPITQGARRSTTR